MFRLDTDNVFYIFFQKDALSTARRVYMYISNTLVQVRLKIDQSVIYILPSRYRELRGVCRSPINIVVEFS